jgi:hypothetical protein
MKIHQLDLLQYDGKDSSAPSKNMNFGFAGTPAGAPAGALGTTSVKTFFVIIAYF